MPNNKLGTLSKQEIRDAMRGLAGPSAKAEAERLAAFYKVSLQYIYDLSADLRPRRKKRADKGSRRAQLMEHSGLKVAASLVVAYNIDPADALETARLRGNEIPVTLATFQRYLREHGLGGKARRTNIVPYRRWEASAPGELFQFDISGTKERWYDQSKRKIVTVSELEVSKNHPNTKPHRVKIWRFSLVDDFSRYTFVRFYACEKPSSSHVVTFLLEAYSFLGVPLQLYADNDATIKFGRNRRATEILERVLADKGGYKVTHHLPGNSKASGKVENSHKRVEKNEKLIGLFLAEGRELTLDVLNRFGEELCLKYNHRIHRTTGEPPMVRWHSQRVVLRKLPTDVLKSAFLADEIRVLIRADVTFSHKGTIYQLPTSERFPFRNWIGQQVTIVFPDEAEFFVLLGLDGAEYEIQRVAAQPDAAGEFGRVADSIGQQNRKALKAYAKQQAQAVKEHNQHADTPLPIPLIDTSFDHAAQPIFFPQPEQAIAISEVIASAPGVVPPSVTDAASTSRRPTDPALLDALLHGADSQLARAGQLIDYFTAADLLLEEGALGSLDEQSGRRKLNDEEAAWLKSIFAGRSEIEDTELRDAVTARPASATVVEIQRRA